MGYFQLPDQASNILKFLLVLGALLATTVLRVDAKSHQDLLAEGLVLIQCLLVLLPFHQVALQDHPLVLFLHLCVLFSRCCHTDLILNGSLLWMILPVRLEIVYKILLLLAIHRQPDYFTLFACNMLLYFGHLLHDLLVLGLGRGQLLLECLHLVDLEQKADVFHPQVLHYLDLVVGDAMGFKLLSDDAAFFDVVLKLGQLCLVLVCSLICQLLLSSLLLDLERDGLQFLPEARNLRELLVVCRPLIMQLLAELSILCPVLLQKRLPFCYNLLICLQLSLEHFCLLLQLFGTVFITQAQLLQAL